MSLKSQKSILLVAEWADPRFQRGVAQYAKEAGWHLNLDSIYSNILPRGWRGDGCIAMAGREALVEFIQSLKVPVVDVTHQTDSPYPRIHEDDHAIGVLAAEYLLNLGFRNFACYRTDPFAVSTVRSDSFAGEIERAGHTTQHLLWDRYRQCGGKDWKQRKDWLARELSKLPKPAALFCIDDRMAVSVTETCMECGIRIPDEIAVLGVGNLDIACECSAVSLSSIRIDFENFGFRAAELLGRVMNGETLPAEPILLPPLGIEERRSTYTLALDDPPARKAVRFMLDHYAAPISVSDAAKAGGLSRRQLTYTTSKELNMGPAKLLEDIRFKQACELLKSTNFTVERAAYETGLGNALRLQRIFRKRLNTTPSAWRKAQ
jgi:LacI family transcriptional regulator